YCLLGINEWGKSSILKAIDFYDSRIINFPNDFFVNSKSVSVEFCYELDSQVLTEILYDINEDFLIHEEIKTEIKSKTVIIIRENIIDGSEKLFNTFDYDMIFEDHTFKGNIIQKKAEEIEENFNFTNFINTHLSDAFWKYSHNIILWRSTPEY